MCKRNRTPAQTIAKAQKQINKLSKKRDKLDRYEKYTPDYELRRKEMTRQIAIACEQKEVAKEQIKHPTPVPKYLDNSRYVNISPDISIQSKNSAKLEAQFGDKNYDTKKKGKTAPSDKKSIVKSIIFITAFVIVTVAVITVTVRFSNCENNKKDNSSTAITAVI